MPPVFGDFDAYKPQLCAINATNYSAAQLKFIKWTNSDSEL